MNVLMDKKNKLLIFMLLIVLLVSVDLRFIFLEADPFPYSVFGATWVDEGVYAHNARNYALFGEWKLENDSWNPIYISPTYTYLELLSFKLFGVNTFAMRLVPALLGILSIVIAGAIYMARKLEEGILFSILLLTNSMHIVYSRIATVESILLALMVVIIALMVFDKKYSWFLAGLLTPVLFFSKIISAFFAASIPVTLLTYAFFYKSKDHIKKLGIFASGAIISLIPWLFWLIPNLSNWKFMNFEIVSNRIGISFIELGVMGLNFAQFSLLNPLLILISAISLSYLCISLFRKGKIEFIDLLLFVSILLFLGQILITDYDLRRFFLIIPILIIISARFILKIEGFDVKFNGKNILIDNRFIVIIFLIIYVIINLLQLFPFYTNIIKDKDSAYTIMENSKEIGKYIPEYAKVYGNTALPLSIENKIKPYHGNYLDHLHNTEENILPILESGKINYAVLKENIFNEADLKEYDRDLNESKVYKYLNDNFEVIKEILGKHSRTSEPDRKYVYRRIISSGFL